eukprot:scaffold118_cov121-Isochrysis_galbana.AAC.4
MDGGGDGLPPLLGGCQLGLSLLVPRLHLAAFVRVVQELVQTGRCGNRSGRKQKESGRVAGGG